MNSSHHWVTPLISTSIGDVPEIATRLDFADRVGTWKVRWGIGRMSYMIPPGLYAIGNPDSKSPVFVTANFKMSFDRVRQALDGRNAWLLVLDTKGINVWCAAGKEGAEQQRYEPAVALYVSEQWEEAGALIEKLVKQALIYTLCWA